MADYTAEIDSAYADIEEAGCAIVLRELVQETVSGDVLQPWKGYKTETGGHSDQNSVGLFTQKTSNEAKDPRVTNDGFVILIPAKGLSPQPYTNMQLLANGVTYSVTAILKTIDFNGQPILHRVALQS